MLGHVYGVALPGAPIKPLELIPTLDVIIGPIIDNGTCRCSQMQIVGRVDALVEGEDRSVVRELVLDHPNLVDVFDEGG